MTALSQVRGIADVGMMTYGEFPLASLEAALRSELVTEKLRAAAERARDDDDDDDARLGRGATFVDVGSGSGRLVLGEAMLRPWARVGGVELMDDMHALACEAADRAFGGGPSGPSSSDAPAAAAAPPPPPPPSLRAAEISLLFGNVDEAADATDTREPVEQARVLMRAADVVFMYSTAMPTVDGVTMTDFTATLCATLRPGTIVITTDKWLDQGYDEAELRVECVGQTEILENPECAGSRCFLWRVFDPRAEDDPSQRDSTAQPNKGEA